ncbi:hypothetical protein POM88_012961 [Heracleum sosnowskyi]|uniref:Uncharacterized protein n=1 Tax=Heracleum sosnowskyi TaxID=360622 RepID=A0AAD8IXP6_9APIA|nr:hypothetical protein POM88_012961 [Heracleum sosnowskyi]
MKIGGLSATQVLLASKKIALNPLEVDFFFGLLDDYRYAYVQGADYDQEKAETLKAYAMWEEKDGVASHKVKQDSPGTKPHQIGRAGLEGKENLIGSLYASIIAFEHGTIKAILAFGIEALFTAFSQQCLNTYKDRKST